MASRGKRAAPAPRSRKAGERNTLRGTRSKNPRTGSSLESLLREEGLYEDATAVAIKRVIAWQIDKEMRDQGISKMKMASAMGTSRSTLDRLLDPDNESVTLSTLYRAASVLGVELRVELVPGS